MSPQPMQRKPKDKRLYDNPDRVRFADFSYAIMRASHNGVAHCPVGFVAEKLRLPAEAAFSAANLDHAVCGKDLYHHALLMPSLAPEGLARPGALWGALRADIFSPDQHLLVAVTLWLPSIRTPHLAIRSTTAFAQSVADKHAVAVHLVAHAPSMRGLGGAFHVHLLCPARQLCGAGLGTFTASLTEPGSQTRMHADWVAHQAAVPKHILP